MAWLKDRTAELHQAKMQKKRLERRSLQADQAVEALQREYDRLTRHNQRCIERRHKTERDILVAQESQSRSSDKLRRAEWTVQRWTELVDRKNYMDPRKFPAEIRETILKLVLAEDHPIRLSEYHLYQPNLGILETCRLMQLEGRAVFYGKNTFEITQDICYDAFFYFFGNIPGALPVHFLQRVIFYMDRTSDIEGLFLLVEGCVRLTRLTIVIQSVPEDYAESLASLQYRRPSELEVEILPEACLEDVEVQTARGLLRDALYGVRYL
ncbi:hypothetical protein OIDMADRAFT_36056 [Oidiodendron maius Zn]|uniref:F-box domain-containing protein n=1 Tax=Oidiodendron maius (strain Zn) TaxID=913774 RepID=A0A0C3GAD3_OIDMZ|nr:hypothetical protein OIDMADRAFT_36056 [Oidiodendron maius Zn]